MSDALCSCVLEMCVSYVLQCNLSEAGMWVSMWLQLCRERQQQDTASVLTVEGIAWQKMFLKKMQNNEGGSLHLRFDFF